MVVPAAQSAPPTLTLLTFTFTRARVPNATSTLTSILNPTLATTVNPARNAHNSPTTPTITTSTAITSKKTTR